MCRICDDWKSKKIDSKQAFERIGNALENQSDSEKIGHLMELSAKVLDEEVPMNESNPELDEKWENEHRQKHED